MRSIPWNNPKVCPTCGKPATEVVGGRRYSEDCARTMRLFLGERAGLGPIVPSPINPLLVQP